MSPSTSVIVRPARRADLPALGRMGAALARAHHGWDPQRFFIVPEMEEGYAWWLGKELRNRRAVVLSAVRGRRVVGYAYGRLEPRDWNALRDACGMGIDLFVVPEARGEGTGRLLVQSLIGALKERGAPRVILQAAAKNRAAQRFFQRAGFRPTMLEMALELPPPPEPPSGKRPGTRPSRERQTRR